MNPERLRPEIENALDKLYLTDTSLLFAPSQIALAAILHSVSKLQENLDSFVTEVLLGPDHKDYISHIIEIIRSKSSTDQDVNCDYRSFLGSVSKT